MPNTPKLGDIIEAYCERCRLNLDVSVAVVTGDTVQQVQCRTCNNFVSFREVVPDSVRKERVFKRVLNMRERKASRSAGAPTGGTGKQAKVDPPSPTLQARQAARARWETLTDGVDSTRAQPYRPERGFAVGDFLLHKSHGMGYVERVAPAGDDPPTTAIVVFRTGEQELPINAED